MCVCVCVCVCVFVCVHATTTVGVGSLQTNTLCCLLAWVPTCAIHEWTYYPATSTWSGRNCEIESKHQTNAPTPFLLLTPCRLSEHENSSPCVVKYLESHNQRWKPNAEYVHVVDRRTPVLAFKVETVYAAVICFVLLNIHPHLHLLWKGLLLAQRFPKLLLMMCVVAKLTFPSGISLVMY